MFLYPEVIPLPLLQYLLEHVALWLLFIFVV